MNLLAGALDFWVCDSLIFIWGESFEVVDDVPMVGLLDSRFFMYFAKFFLNSWFFCCKAVNELSLLGCKSYCWLLELAFERVVVNPIGPFEFFGVMFADWIVLVKLL